MTPIKEFTKALQEAFPPECETTAYNTHGWRVLLVIPGGLMNNVDHSITRGFETIHLTYGQQWYNEIIREEGMLLWETRFTFIMNTELPASETVMNTNCKVCDKTDDKKPMTFRGEPYCSDRHRKVLEGKVELDKTLGLRYLSLNEKSVVK